MTPDPRSPAPSVKAGRVVIFEVRAERASFSCVDELRRREYLVRSFRSIAAAGPQIADCELLLAPAEALTEQAIADLAARAPGPALVALYRAGDEEAGLEALERGADDCFPLTGLGRELLARVRAILRRRRMRLGEAAASQPSSGQSLERQVALLRQAGLGQVRFSPREFELLRVLAHRPGAVLSRAQLMDQAPGGEAFVYDRAIDSAVSRLRRKVVAALGCDIIRTHRSAGYSLSLGPRADR